MFSNTEKPAIKLDGTTITDTKAPTGDPVKATGKIEGDKLVITALDGAFDGTTGVEETYAIEGEFLVISVKNIATGTTFTEKRGRA